MPSTKQHCPYVHLSSRWVTARMRLFDIGDDTVPILAQHTGPTMALRMNSVEEIEQAKARLEAHGVPVLGDGPSLHQVDLLLRSQRLMAELTHEIGLVIEKARERSQARSWKVEKKTALRGR